MAALLPVTVWADLLHWLTFYNSLRRENFSFIVVQYAASSDRAASTDRPLINGCILLNAAGRLYCVRFAYHAIKLYLPHALN